MSPRLILALVAGLVLAGCSTAPLVIRTAPIKDLSLAQVLRDPRAHSGEAVRWGGRIVAVTNRDDRSWIEVVEHPLYRGGEPRPGSDSAGRFLIRAEGLLDPAIYAKDREVTVAGTLAGTAEGQIGEQPYTFPVVASHTVYLWPPYPPYYDDYYYYPPYPYYPYYHRGLYFGHRHHGLGYGYYY